MLYQDLMDQKCVISISWLLTSLQDCLSIRQPDVVTPDFGLRQPENRAIAEDHILPPPTMIDGHGITGNGLAGNRGVDERISIPQNDIVRSSPPMQKR